MDGLVKRMMAPVTETGTRPKLSDPGSKYIRSFLVLRIMVGAIGAALPVLLVVVDRFVLDQRPFLRDSLSVYYYFGVRDLFVGALCATGVFLIAYKVVEVSLDNTLSTIAGGAAIGVALFPTGRPTPDIIRSPLQRLLGEDPVKYIHYGCAFLFIVSLAILCVCFGYREGKRPRREGKRTPQFWRAFHWTGAGIIGAAVVFMGIATGFGRPNWALLAGETASIWAFGVSWLMKGLELDTLRGKPAD